jgi:hypothetical protein
VEFEEDWRGSWWSVARVRYLVNTHLWSGIHSNWGLLNSNSEGSRRGDRADMGRSVLRPYRIEVKGWVEARRGGRAEQAPPLQERRGVANGAVARNGGWSRLRRAAGGSEVDVRMRDEIWRRRLWWRANFWAGRMGKVSLGAT